MEQKHAPQVPESLALLREAVAVIDGASFSMIDQKTQRLAQVAVGEKTYYPSAVKIPIYPLNSANAAELVTDKAYTNELLDQAGIVRTAGDYFFVRSAMEKYDVPGITAAQAYAKTLGYPVFCKPNRGSSGSQADLCFSDDELATLGSEIAQTDYVMHVQKVYDEREFRIFCIDGEIQFGYERVRPVVVGDGEQTVRELISAVNHQAEYDIQRINQASNFLTHQLAIHSLTLESVLEAGKELRVSAAANIARGGQITELTRDDFSSTLISLAKRVSDLFNLRVCGIDYFANNFSGDDAVVIEVNHNPSLKGIAAVDREFAISVWQTILEKFRES